MKKKINKLIDRFCESTIKANDWLEDHAIFLGAIIIGIIIWQVIEWL